MTKARFRWMVAGSIGLLFVGVVILFLFDQPLPSALGAWVEAEASSEWTILDALGAAAAVMSMAASFGLLFFARWSRPVYAASVATVTVAALFAGPSVSTAAEAFLSEIVLLVDGFIIATAYFSEVRHCFERATNT